ncbi:hypothetical protein EDB85DRAFT_2223757 [Lactarius pseudohatsudake]|nr:hypothetical protein EDB85DRAFT_2223757 [Lactarius pseudohatsudake]
MGTSPPNAIRELLFPPLRIDMPVPVSSGHQPPNPIQTQLKSPRSASSRQGSLDSLPSAGSGAYDTRVIPPSHEARTLVLSLMGRETSLTRFILYVKEGDKSQQLTYYQAGIGTYTIPEVASPHMAKLKKNIDMAVGSHLDAHVMEHYHAEDKICIFGFSRGAYTARALAGMIHKVCCRSVDPGNHSLGWRAGRFTSPGNHQQVPFAYKMFTRNDDIGWSQSTMFKKAFSVDVEMEFIGVWDTVCSVG